MASRKGLHSPNDCNGLVAIAPHPSLLSRKGYFPRRPYRADPANDAKAGKDYLAPPRNEDALSGPSDLFRHPLAHRVRPLRNLIEHRLSLALAGRRRRTDKLRLVQANQ